MKLCFNLHKELQRTSSNHDREAFTQIGSTDSASVFLVHESSSPSMIMVEFHEPMEHGEAPMSIPNGITRCRYQGSTGVPHVRCLMHQLGPRRAPP
jgi:hypothetical protein